MNIRLLAAAFVVLASASSFAANTTTKISSKRAPAQTVETTTATDNRSTFSAGNVTKELRTREPGKILNGVTASALLTTTSAQVSSSGRAGSSLYDSQTLGAKIGYSQVNVRAPGILARVAFGTKVGGGAEWDDYSYIRPEVDATYGFNNLTYLLGGLNINRFVRGEDYQSYGMNLGWQAGVGMALTQTAFAELQYVYTKNDYSRPDRNGEREQRNLELGAGFNF